MDLPDEEGDQLISHFEAQAPNLASGSTQESRVYVRRLLVTPSWSQQSLRLLITPQRLGLFLAGLALFACALTFRQPESHRQEQEPAPTARPRSSPGSDGGVVGLQARLRAAPGLPIVELWQTAAGGGLLQKLPDSRMVPEVDVAFSGPEVRINASHLDQTVLGFGGAFTESSALVFQNLAPDMQEAMLRAYFDGAQGIGFTLGRVHINSCDFSNSSYSFDDHAEDFELKHFDHTVRRDAAVLIPLIQRAQAVVTQAGQQLNLLATPWSPPAWMKTNHKMNGSPPFAPGLRKECSGVWARYISEWISAYKAFGLTIRAVTAQNEPAASSAWEACRFSPEEEAAFVGDHLGPTLRSRHPEVAIFVHDHNKDIMYDYARAVNSNPRAKQYMDGVAFHWYSGDFFENVAKVHEDFPRAVLLGSEATYERHRWHDPARNPAPDWSFGEGYAHDIIGDLNAGASGWVDWNLLLDEAGGPNHLGNTCDAAAIEQNAELKLHPQYYFLGHFSKFILPGSKRVGSQVLGSQRYSGVPRPYGTCTQDDGLEATAFLRPDTKLALVVLNCGNAPVRFKIGYGEHALAASIPAHAIQTYVVASVAVPSSI